MKIETTATIYSVSNVDLNGWRCELVLEHDSRIVMMRKGEFALYVQEGGFGVYHVDRGTIAEMVATIDEAVALCK